MRRWPSVPLFTEPELAQAFAYLLPPDVATRVAREWFESNVEERVDGQYFMYEHWESPSPDGNAWASAAAEVLREADIEPSAAKEAAFWNALTQAERIEWLCPRFSGIHFDLVGQLSDAHHERMREALRESFEWAEHRRRIVRRVIDLVQVS